MPLYDTELGQVFGKVDLSAKYNEPIPPEHNEATVTLFSLSQKMGILLKKLVWKV